jgi:hypothetical protein
VSACAQTVRTHSCAVLLHPFGSLALLRGRALHRLRFFRLSWCLNGWLCIEPQPTATQSRVVPAFLPSACGTSAQLSEPAAALQPERHHTHTHIESPCLGNCVHGGSITTQKCQPERESRGTPEVGEGDGVAFDIIMIRTEAVTEIPRRFYSFHLRF